jgi:hypothetical protein
VEEGTSSRNPAVDCRGDRAKWASRARPLEGEWRPSRLCDGRPIRTGFTPLPSRPRPVGVEHVVRLRCKNAASRCTANRQKSHLLRPVESFHRNRQPHREETACDVQFRCLLLCKPHFRSEQRNLMRRGRHSGQGRCRLRRTLTDPGRLYGGDLMPSEWQPANFEGRMLCVRNAQSAQDKTRCR